MYIGDNMNLNKFTTVTIERETLIKLKATNANKRSVNVLIQDLVDLHNGCKCDMGY